MIDPYDDDIDHLGADMEENILAPDGDEDATRYLRWLRKASDEVEEIDERFDHEIDKLGSRQRDMRAGPLARVERLEHLLSQYALAVRAETGLTKIDLPHGTLSTRAGSTRIEIDDEAATLTWWDKVGADLRSRLDRLPIVHEVTTRKVSKSEIATLLAATKLAARTDGTIIDAATGEIIPGIRQVTGDMKATIDPT